MENRVTAPRLMIDKVVLENFKSYAGIKEIGPFHKNFTAVVGPNGSGKSNLLECLLFAFGKRARQMRLKKLSELIHVSNRFPDLNFAKVSVYFHDIIDTEDGYQVVQNSNFVLTRIVQKDGSSSYKLNGMLSSHEQVTTALKARGIDLEHNRFLILQGEVEQIAMMKPRASPGEDAKTGLLEYLEEIIGTNSYVPLIQEAVTKLENIGDEVLAKNQRVEEASKAVSQLEGPKNEALAFIELEKERHEIINTKNQVSRFIHVEQEKVIVEQIEQIDIDLKEVENQFEIKKQENIIAIKEFEKSRDEVMKLKTARNELKFKLQEAIDKDNELNEDIKALRNKKIDTEGKVAALNKKKEGIKDSLIEMTEKIPQIETELIGLKAEKIQVEAEFQARNLEIMTATEEMQNQKLIYEKENIPLLKQLDDLKAKAEIKRQQIEFLVSEKAQEEQERAYLEKEILNCENTYDLKVKQLEEIGLRFSTVNHDADTKHKMYEQLIRDLEITRNQLNEEKRQLHEFEDLERKAEGRNRLIQDIMNGKRTGELTGIYGRLGDLGAVDPKYDIAVSSATSRMDFIVVQTVSDADNLLEFVRRRGLGRVNIIPLDKVSMQYERLSRVEFQCPDEKTKRIFDLIKYEDQKIGSAFYFALTDTLVTESMDHARKIAFGPKRYRVVTLNGEVISPSGEMQGFAKPKSGAINLLGQNRASFSPEDLSDLQERIRELAAKFSDLNSKAKQYQTEMASEKKDKLQFDHQLMVLKNEGAGLKERIQKFKTRESELIAKIQSQKNSENEVEELRLIVAKNEQATIKILKLIADKQVQIQQIEQEIDIYGGEEFKELKRRRQNLNEAEDTLESEAGKMQKKLHQVKNDYEKLMKQIQELDVILELTNSDLAKKREEIETLKPLALELAEQSEDIRKDYENKIEIVRQLQQTQDYIKKQFEQILENRDKLKDNRKGATNNLRNAQSEINRWDQRIIKNREEFSGLLAGYQDLLSCDMDLDIEKLEDKNENHEENPRKRTKRDDERKAIRFPVNHEFSVEEIQGLLEKLEFIKHLEVKIQEELTKSRPNLQIIEEYRSRVQEKNAKESEFCLIKNQEMELRKRYSDLSTQRLQEFYAGYTIISQKLREMYRMITRGGDAELEFADSTDPFSEGIVFTVRPPNKSWKKMANLSGGEKTLSSLSLVFALHHYKPNALYVMDEVDAALDFQNVSVIANYIKDRTKNAQFIIVSLRYQMFELADRLVGVYKTKDVSQTISISPCTLIETDKSNPIIRQTLSNIKINS